MKKKFTGCSRRQFLQLAGAAGVGSLLRVREGVGALPAKFTAQSNETLKVPTRAFGKNGRQVSILALGGMFDIAANQLMLKQALRWGVTYWDTADCYHHGSEAGIGNYFAKYPQDRANVFLVTKSDARDPAGLSRLLEQSLERLKTTYIDLYFIHGMRDIDELNEDTRRWAEKAKSQGKIRMFGFSTHSNMEQCLLDASKLGWIDGIMLAYNYRTMHSKRMQEAVSACTEAGIGLTAMKTQGSSSWFGSQGDDLFKQFMAKGFTEEQAKLKAVWQNPQIASICSQMDSMKLLKANVNAAADPTPLADRDVRRLQRYAAQTTAQYCAGCSRICEEAIGGTVPIGDVMRYHMYGVSYGRGDWAKAHLAALPSEIRGKMAVLDFAEAEHRCPQKMPIGRLMRTALVTWG